MKIASTGKLTDILKRADPRALPWLWGGLLAVFILVDVFFVMLPQVHGVFMLYEKAGRIRQDMDTLSANKGRIGELSRQRDILSAKIGDLERMIYSKKDLPVVLQKISTRASKDGIQVDQITPRQDAQVLLCEHEGKKYYAMPILIQARSGFLKFQKFLAYLEKEYVFWQADSFSFMADAQYPQRNQIRFTIKVIVVDG